LRALNEIIKNYRKPNNMKPFTQYEYTFQVYPHMLNLSALGCTADDLLTAV
jgi:hypothetical protein